MPPKGSKGSGNQAKLYNEIILGIDGVNPKLPRFEKRFHPLEPQPGVRLPLLEGDGQQVAHCHEDALAGAIMRYCNYQTGNARYLLTMTQAREVARMYLHAAEAVPTPKPVAMLSEPGLTFHRLPFDATEGDCPVFKEFLGRCTNPEALAVFIGSLFDPGADRQQYVYLHGGGSNGKGALARMLAKLLGPAFHSETVPTGSYGPNQFWTSSFLGKRLVVFAECNNPTFPTSGLFKSLTGDDEVRIEKKGKDAFSAKLTCKFMFLSNERLSLSSQTADVRRAIYCFVGPIAGGQDPTYESRLWSEAPQILKFCADLYAERCGAGRTIAVEDSADELADLHDARFEDFFHQHFLLVGDDGLPSELRSFVTARDVYGVFQRGGISSSREINKHLDYWERHLGIRKIQPPKPAEGLRPPRRYLGIRLKSHNGVTFEKISPRRQSDRSETS